jgi:hypothetical protein
LLRGAIGLPWIFSYPTGVSQTGLIFFFKKKSKKRKAIAITVIITFP